jgi:two-component system chemotaxis response regulator CheB
MELADKVSSAAKAKAHVQRRHRAGARAPSRPAAPAPLPRAPGRGAGDAVILIGASTGGCEALPQILASFPPDAPPIVCVQHIPPVFSRSFADRLDGLGGLRVSEAAPFSVLESGHVYVAPGGKHLVLGGSSRPTLEVREGPLVNRHRPSIDVTFRSAAERFGPRCAAALLTGMGDDGVEGLAAIQAAGGFTLAQDEATSVVYGMPREAARRGAARVVAPLESIGGILLSEARRRSCA